MRILVICQYYYPEPFRIQSICEQLVKRGHEVHVVTGYPNYPDGIIYKGYGIGKKIDQIINGVYIHRCLTLPRKKGIIHRVLNYYSYSFFSKRYVTSDACCTSDGKSFDVVFCNQLSPVMMAEAAIAYKYKHHVPIIMYCLDLWPESLIAGHIKRSSGVYKYYFKISNNIYSKMDKILVSSRMFVDFLSNKFGIEQHTIEYLPQYAEDVFKPRKTKKVDGNYVFTFAGNIGEAQSIETILKAAEVLSKEPITFNIVGGGSNLDSLRKMSYSLQNVKFYGRRPLCEMPEIYAKSDAMLVTLRKDPILSLTIPGKIQSYMAAGKPIIGAIDGETKIVIDAAKCGYCGKAEDYIELTQNIRKFINNPDKEKMSSNARKYYEENFSEEIFVDRLEEVIKHEVHS